MVECLHDNCLKAVGRKLDVIPQQRVTFVLPIYAYVMYRVQLCVLKNPLRKYVTVYKLM